MKKKTAVVLLSGGMDSATTLAFAQREDYEIYALSFHYGQRHSVELDAARRIVEASGVREHRIAEIDLRVFGGSALTAEIPVPKDRPIDPAGPVIPITYVPARNTIFLAYALAWAEVLGCGNIFMGVNALDYSGYPDCRPEYIEAFERMGNLATRAGVEGTTKLKVHTPLIHMKKSEIIRAGLELGVDFSLTSTCYDPDAEGRACGHCDACQLRLRGFEEVGIRDPGKYRV